MSATDPTPLAVEWEEWIAPTPEAVAQLLRARTKDDNGVEIGMWTDKTRPTLDEVIGIIDLAVGQLMANIGISAPLPCSKGATKTAALLAAMLVELSYWPEQVRSDRSAYSEYKDLYDANLVALQRCISAGGGGGEGMGDTWASLPVRPDHYWERWPPGWWDGLRGPWGDVGPDHWPEPENPANWAQPFQPPREPPQPEDLPVGDEPASGVEQR